MKSYCHRAPWLCRLKFILISLLLFENVLSDVSYYELLGVSKKASTHEIKQAYKKLAVKLHPDKNPNTREQKRFLEITEAYETLKDPQKRHKYDMYGSQQSYTKKYDYHSQAEYNDLYYNGLYHNDPFVITLSGKRFDSYLEEGLYFINFYSPFCPPCQNLADDWKKLAEVYNGIIKIGAVNCKYHNSFCFNTMRIGSYPTLLFYPNGKHRNFLYYRGEHSFEALEEFVLKFLRDTVNVPTITKLRSTDDPMVYILDDSLDEKMLLRIAYHLDGLASVVMATNIRPRVSKNLDAVIVFKYKRIYKEIFSSDEKTILSEIVDMLPKIEEIGLEQLKEIRSNLRNGDDATPWVLYFSKEGDDKLLLYQMRIGLPDINFGIINCDTLPSLCESLQVWEAPCWALLKAGGAYQRLYAAPTEAALRAAARALPLHTLSPTDFQNIYDGDMSPWVLLVVPYQVTWDHYAEPFTQACLEMLDADINFGIMICTLNTDSSCRLVAQNEPVILLQNGTKRHMYGGDADKAEIVEFIDLIRENADMELTEAQVLEIQHSSRTHTWVVAYLPAACGRVCRDLLHEWRRVAKRLRPLASVRVGVLECARGAGLCANVRAAAARLYPAAAQRHYTVSLEHLSEAPYILEWALEHIDNSIMKVNWQSFTKTVIAEELNPSRNKKPWLIYFHSPRCYRCYEMYPDFAIVANMLSNSMHFGKVNCMTERTLCQHEYINSYPSIRLYLNRNKQNTVSRVVPIQPKGYMELIKDIKPHLRGYDENILLDIESMGIKSHIRFRDEL
ncbi:unnamed protein product, partial [Brenthis ino]